MVSLMLISKEGESGSFKLTRYDSDHSPVGSELFANIEDAKASMLTLAKPQLLRVEALGVTLRLRVI